MAKRIIEQLLRAAKVQRIISVDDLYANKLSVEDALALVEPLEFTITDKIFAKHPTVVGIREKDIRNQQIRTIWEELDYQARGRLMKALQFHTNGPRIKSSDDAVDEKAIAKVSEFFGQYDPITLSLEDWRKRRNELVNDQMPPTFIMVDEDFSREGGGSAEGLNIIRELLSTPEPERILCALLSHKYQRATIHQDWDDLCKNEGFDKSRVVLIPKVLLTDEPISFARLMKLAILNGSVEKLKKRVIEILDNARNQALSRLNGIDIYDFDQIVFRSSYEEGIWEPDTLFRLFGLFHNHEARQLAKDDVELRNLAVEIRQVSRIQTESPSAPNYNTIEVQRLERYEESDYLNAQLAPIDVGDIFQETGDSGRRYILLAQSCDLMVRKDGKRNQAINEAIVAEIVVLDPDYLDRYGELKYFDRQNVDRCFVDFKQTHAIRLSVLDLCAFQPNGEATFTVGGSCPDGVIPSWKERYAEISAEVNGILSQVEKLTAGGLELKIATALTARCSNDGLFPADIDLQHKTVTFGVRRVGRLKQPRAAGLLSRYANFLARQAFDHDFGAPDRRPTAEHSEAASVRNVEVSSTADSVAADRRPTAEHSEAASVRNVEVSSTEDSVAPNRRPAAEHSEAASVPNVEASSTEDSVAPSPSAKPTEDSR